MKTKFQQAEDLMFYPLSEEDKIEFIDKLNELDFEIPEEIKIDFRPDNGIYVKENYFLIIDSDHLSEIDMYLEGDVIVITTSFNMKEEYITAGSEIKAVEIADPDGIVTEWSADAVILGNVSDSTYGTDGDGGLAEDWVLDKKWQVVDHISGQELGFIVEAAVDPKGDVIYVKSEEDLNFFFGIFERSNIFAEKYTTEMGVYVEDITLSIDNGNLILEK